MAVKLKLTRLGSKKHPFYRVVAATDETRRDGRPLEFLGYCPRKKLIRLKSNSMPDKIKEWLARGAEPTDTVRALIKKHMALAHFAKLPPRRQMPCGLPHIVKNSGDGRLWANRHCARPLLFRVFPGTGLWRCIMKALIEYIARSLVDHPDEVQVSEVEGEQTTVLELRLPGGTGQGYQQRGRTAKPMHHSECRFHHCKKRTVLEILE